MSDSISAPVEEMAFGQLTIRFDGRVLRPRPWTTAQSEWAAELARTAPPGQLLELCAGAGQIGLLAIALEPRPLVCVDLNPAACELVRENAFAAGLTHLVDVRAAPLEEAVSGGERFAVVIADPPWVRHADIGRYPDDPTLAIDGGDDGLALARACTAVAARHLLPGGSAVLQLGTAAQADALADELPALGGLELTEVRVFGRGVLVRLFRPSGA